MSDWLPSVGEGKVARGRESRGRQPRRIARGGRGDITQYDLIMQQLISDCNDPTASLPSFLA